ncbi:hypothetical protein HK102_008590 [Quaeritorhiza haematococci]|nr:hypothetical protein HK102_008590 [Quaeritorhiza haematococci]
MFPPFKPAFLLSRLLTLLTVTVTLALLVPTPTLAAQSSASFSFTTTTTTINPSETLPITVNYTITSGTPPILRDIVVTGEFLKSPNNGDADYYAPPTVNNFLLYNSPETVGSAFEMILSVSENVTGVLPRGTYWVGYLAWDIGNQSVTEAIKILNETTTPIVERVPQGWKLLGCPQVQFNLDGDGNNGTATATTIPFPKWKEVPKECVNGGNSFAYTSGVTSTTRVSRVVLFFLAGITASMFF